MFMCFLYLLEALICCGGLVWRSKDLLNPFVISGGTWMLCAGLAQLHLSSISRSWCFETHIAVHLFFYTVIICGFLFMRHSNNNNKKYEVNFTKAFTYSYFVLIIVVVLCSLLEWKANNFSIAILDTTKSGDLKSGRTALTGIHYFSLCLPYCALISFFCLLYGGHKYIKLHIMVIIYAFCYAILIEISRGTLLIMFLGMLLIYHSKKRLNFVKLFGVGFIVLALLCVLMVIRLQNNSSLVFTAIEGNMYLSSIYTYIETPFLNLDQLITNGSPYSMVYATVLRPLCQVLRLQLDFNYLEYDTYFFNARTIIYGFYHDMGLLGILLFTLIIYIIVGYIYNSAKHSARWVLMLAALQKAIYMPVFGNYFTGTVANSFPFVVVFLLTLLLKTKPTNYTAMFKGGTYNE